MLKDAALVERLFGGTSPAREVLIVVKQLKQVQLQDVFNILFSIPDLSLLLWITILRKFISVSHLQYGSFSKSSQLQIIRIFEHLIKYTCTEYFSLPTRIANIFSSRYFCH